MKSIEDITINFNNSYETIIGTNDGKNIVHDDFLIIEHIREIDRTKINYDEINKTNQNMITFDFGIYLLEILKSYNFNKKNIWDQLVIDFPRTNVFIDRQNLWYWDLKLIKINTVEEFKQKLSKYKRYECNFDNNNFDLLTIFAAICTQASYYLPYVFIHNLSVSDDTVLSSLSSNRNVIFYTNDKYLSIKLEANFALKNIKTCEVIKYYSILMNIESLIPNNEHNHANEIKQLCDIGVLNFETIEKPCDEE